MNKTYKKDLEALQDDPNGDRPCSWAEEFNRAKCQFPPKERGVMPRLLGRARIRSGALLCPFKQWSTRHVQTALALCTGWSG